MTDDLVRVAVAANQTEAEFYETLLADVGIPVLIKRTSGFDVPDYLAAGARDLLVAPQDEAKAREVLRERASIEPAEISGPNPRLLLGGLLLAVAVVALLVLIAFA